MLLEVAVLLVAIAAASAKEIPDYIQVCKGNDPDLSGCVTRSIAHIQPYLGKGIPELNVPPVEPLLLEELVPVDGKGLKISCKNLKTYGCSDFQISNLKIDVDKLTMELDVFHPHLYFQGEYTVDGKILLLQLSGSGMLTGNATECRGHIKINFELRKGKTGEDFLYCTKFDVKSQVSKGHIHLDNLFGGDPVLGETVNSAINTNFAAFAKEFGPLIDSALSKAMKGISNNILSTFSHKQLFPVD